MTKLLDMLEARYAEGVDELDRILDRCHAEGDRAPDLLEAAQLDRIHADLVPLGERLLEVRSHEERRHKAITAMSGGELRPVGAVPLVAAAEPGVETRSEVQGRGGIPPLWFGESQLRQVMAAVKSRGGVDTSDMEPRRPLQNRATVATPPGGIIGTWPQPFSVTGREPRLAEYAQLGTADGNLVQYLRVNNPAVSAVRGRGRPETGFGSVDRPDRRSRSRSGRRGPTSPGRWCPISGTPQLINTEMLGRS